MNTHLPHSQQPQPFPMDLRHVPPEALRNFLQQFNPQPPQHPSPSIQPDLEQAAELVSLREGQAQQAKEIEELTRWINENISDGDPGSTTERDLSKKRKNVKKKKSKFVLNVPIDTLDEDQAETRTQLMVSK